MDETDYNIYFDKNYKMIFLRRNIEISFVFLLVSYASIYQIGVHSSSSVSAVSSRLRGTSSSSNVHRRIQTSSASTFVLTESTSTQVLLNNEITTDATNPIVTTINLPPYFIKNDLGAINYDVALGNPLKGLAKNPMSDGMINTGVSFSLEAFYVRFDSVVRGSDGMYNWTMFDQQLNSSMSRNVHAIPRFYITYPGSVIGLPTFLIDNVPMKQYYDQGILQYTPYFGDSLLLKEIQNFIYAFGKRYDGDKRIAFVQAGILGFWGEWHCNGMKDCIPESVKDSVVQWYRDAFSITKIQIRNPRPTSKIAKFGYHDDSFTFATLDGPANGNVYRRFFFWNRVVAENETNFWKHAPMGMSLIFLRLLFVVFS